MADKMIDIVVGNPRRVALVLLLLTVGIGHRAAFLVQDNSPETFYAVDEKAEKTYRALVRTFESDEIVLVSLVSLVGAQLVAKDLKAIGALAEAIKRIPGIKGVISPADIFEHLKDRTDALIVKRTKSEIEAISLYRELGLYRKDAPALSVMASIVGRGPEARPTITAALDALSSRFQSEGYRLQIVGLTAAHAAIDRETKRATTIFMPLVVLVVGLVGFLIFRSVKAVLAMLIPVSASVLIGAGALELMGESMNLVTAVMPPLVLAIGFSGAIHLVSHYGNCSTEGGCGEDCVRRTLRDKFVPTAFAFATTAVGFASLAISDVRSVSVLGIASAAALCASLVMITLGTPVMLLFLKPAVHAPEHRYQMLQHLALFSVRHRWPILILASFLIVPTVFGIMRIGTSVDGMEILGDDMEAKQSFRQLEAEGVGLYPIDVWIHRSVKKDELLAVARKSDRVARALREEVRLNPKAYPNVTGIVGVHSIVKLFNFRLTGGKGIPDDPVPWDMLPDADVKRAEVALKPFVREKEGLRFSVLTTTTTAEAASAFAEKIRAAVRTEFGEVDVDISGHYMMLIGTPGKLMATMFGSLGLTVGTITLLFMIAFRSVLLGLSGMLVNLIPVGFIISLMGWVGVPADVATVMVGSVAFGLAVDDTFHYLYHRKESGSIVRAAAIAGQGIVATSIMVSSGLAVLALSGFVPVVRFGWLTALAVLVALAVDAVILPALVGRRSELEGAS